MICLQSLAVSKTSRLEFFAIIDFLFLLVFELLGDFSFFSSILLFYSCMLKSKHSLVLKRPASKPNKAHTLDLNFLKASITVISLYSRCWNLGGLSLMSERLMVTVAVAENAPGCPTISLAWMMTKYWSSVSLSIWEATLMTPKNKKCSIIAYRSHFFSQHLTCVCSIIYI